MNILGADAKLYIDGELFCELESVNAKVEVESVGNKLMRNKYQSGLKIRLNRSHNKALNKLDER